MTICPHYELAVGHGHESIVRKDEHDHVTLDLDGTTKTPSKFYLYDPKNREVIRCVHSRLSASRKGLHILICLTQPLNSMEKFIFRFWNHDDVWRLSYDMLRYDDVQILGADEKGKDYATGTLFDLKNGKTAGDWRRSWQK